MKHIPIRIMLYMVGLTLLLSELTACGGGGGSPPPTPANRAPQAMAGVNKTVLENDSMILDARGSSDVDGDRLSYQWTQLSGPEVLLSNATSAQPSFVAPSVEATTELVFELQVTDAQNQVSTDSVNIVIQKRSLADLAKQLMVRPINTALAVQAGESVDVAYQYESTAAAPAGLMLKVHWDSSRLSFTEFSEVLAVNHLGVSEPMQDTQDADHNPDTDQYVILSWLDYENAEWLVSANLPAPLFSAHFEPVAGASGSTYVTVSPHFSSPGYTLQTQVVSVEL